MMKKPMGKMPARPMAGRPAPARAMPTDRVQQPAAYMANGGSVKKMASMAGNAKAGTCGPGVSSRKK